MNDRNGEKAAANADKKGRTAQKRERENYNVPRFRVSDLKFLISFLCEFLEIGEKVRDDSIWTSFRIYSNRLP